MKKIIQLLSVSGSCIALAACGLTTGGTGSGGAVDLSVTQLHSLEGKNAVNSLIKRVGSVSVDTTNKTATLIYNGETFSDLAESPTVAGVYGSSSGDKFIYVKPINVGSDSGLWQVGLINQIGTDTIALAYAIEGTPTADLPTGKSDYIGSLSAFLGPKDASNTGGVANETTGSLSLQMDFGAGTFSGKTINHLDADLNSVAGHIEITNGKINGGKATYDIATKNGLVANLGVLGGAMSGSGDARFYKDDNATGPNFLGTGSLESSTAVGVFGLSTGYHPSN